MRPASSVGCEALAQKLSGSWPAYGRPRTTSYPDSVSLVYASRVLCVLTVSLTVSLACRPRFLARRCTAPGNGTIRNRFRILCIPCPSSWRGRPRGAQVPSYKGPANLPHVVSRVGANSLIQ
jgi:hypothetical protein